MAEVTLQIGDRQHRVACTAGTEEQVRTIAARLHARWPDARRASGGMSDERTMLFVALMLADALDEAEKAAPAPMAPPPPPSTTEIDALDLARLAERLEAIATALENSIASA